MDLEEIGINAGNWVDSVQNRNYWRALVSVVLNVRVSYRPIVIHVIYPDLTYVLNRVSGSECQK